MKVAQKWRAATADHADERPTRCPHGRAGTSAPLVAIRDLTKHYMRGDQVIPVLVDINLDVEAGDSSR